MEVIVLGLLTLNVLYLVEKARRLVPGPVQILSQNMVERNVKEIAKK